MCVEIFQRHSGSEPERALRFRSPCSAFFFRLAPCAFSPLSLSGAFFFFFFFFFFFLSSPRTPFRPCCLLRTLLAFRRPLLPRRPRYHVLIYALQDIRTPEGQSNGKGTHRGRVEMWGQGLGVARLGSPFRQCGPSVSSVQDPLSCACSRDFPQQPSISHARCLC